MVPLDATIIVRKIRFSERMCRKLINVVQLMIINEDKVRGKKSEGTCWNNVIVPHENRVFGGFFVQLQSEKLNANVQA